MSVESIITENLDIWTSATKTKSTSGRGSSNKRELYGIKKLRELILELAVTGKLIKPDTAGCSAQSALERSISKKSKLISEGRLKKGRAKKNIEDEHFYSYPKHWEAARLEDLINVINGRAYKKHEMLSEGIPILRVGNLFTSDQWYYSDLTLEPDKYIDNGDLIYSWSASFGPFIWEGGKVIYHYHIWKMDIFCDDSLDKEFSQIFLQAISERIKAGGNGIAMIHMTKERMEKVIHPLPPLEEQKKIAKKVRELMNLCDQLESQSEASIEAHQTLVKSLLDTLTNAKDSNELNESWQRISEHFDVLFTTEDSIDQLKQTILQLAVMGKLVKQDPNDEPASKLLGRIAAEKEQLIKDKKIKKQKALPLISEGEKPFQLPRGWEWCRLEDVVDIQSGITKGRKLAGKQVTRVAYLSVANVQRGFLKLEQLKEVEIAVEEVAKYEVRVGDLLITEGGDWDKVGRTAIWNGSIPYIAHQNHVFKARKILDEQNELWLETYLNSPFARDYFAGSSKQTTNLASINKTQLRGCLIAIPPPNHQSEILSSIRSVVELCESLLQKLKSKSKTECSLVELVAQR
ncbi:restriction endonuclease subunit S [Salinimonas sp. HHU 13199]|uniref:Restriction endonuclease subunit S n=1 Tax=Salinimonas profundi TaxID=2729140 RepID=A0ABR8LQ45_9ALTE|nr:restriction endonuclease subunit S [Salinimonas profundi]MBD3587430.1 restriction endonuclease subunit S [Salinimonas profundi]